MNNLLKCLIYAIYSCSRLSTFWCLSGACTHATICECASLYFMHLFCSYSLRNSPSRCLPVSSHVLPAESEPRAKICHAFSARLHFILLRRIWSRMTSCIYQLHCILFKRTGLKQCIWIHWMICSLMHLLAAVII